MMAIVLVGFPIEIWLKKRGLYIFFLAEHHAVAVADPFWNVEVFFGFRQNILDSDVFGETA